MKKLNNIHKVAGIFVFLIIFIFWGSTVITELFFDKRALFIVKQSIVFYGLISLVLFIMMTGITGMFLSRANSSIYSVKKLKRMPIIAINGVLIMIPVAIYLYIKAKNSEFDLYFYSFQLVELSIGLIQLILIARQIIDGKRATNDYKFTKFESY